MKRYSLGIIQTHATQFDGPFFRELAAAPDIDLTVYFTRPESLQASYDPEIGQRSGWDHDISSGYRSFHFPEGFCPCLRFVRGIMAEQHDLVIIGGYASLNALMVAIQARVHRIPVGLRSDSVFLYDQAKNWKSRIKDRLLPLLYKLYATGHPTGSLAQAYMQYYGFAEDALFLFPYAVDHDYLHTLYQSATRQKASLRREAGIEPDAFVVLGILKFVLREDPETLLQAYRQVVQVYPDTHLVMVGDGELRQSLEVYIQQQALKQVHLTGYVPYSKLPSYFALADVFVHPARREPWGVSVQEAMVCHTPVIAANTVGAAADLIEAGKTGFVFESGNPCSLAESLRHMISKPGMGQEMAGRAYANVQHWRYPALYTQFVKALEYVREHS